MTTNEQLRKLNALKQGIQPELQHVDETVNAKDLAPPSLREVSSSHSLAVFYRILSTMLQAGISVHLAIEKAGEHIKEEDPRLSNLVANLAKRLGKGKNLSDVIERMNTFGPFTAAMVKVGENTGDLSSVFGILADQEEETSRNIQDLKSTFAYPLALIVIAALVVVFAPAQFAPIFRTSMNAFNEELPFQVEFFFSLSEFAWNGYLWLTIAILVVLNWKALVGYLKSASLRRTLVRIGNYVPGFKQALSALAQESFTRLLANQLEAGVPLLLSVKNALEGTGNPLFVREWETISKDLQNGTDLALTLNATGLFETSLISMIEVGAKSGKLPFMLSKLSKLQSQQLRYKFETAKGLLEPMALLLVAGLVGSLVLSVFLPMTRFIQAL